MTWHDWKRTAQLFAGKSLYDELLTLSNKARNRVEQAVRDDDVEGQMYYQARADLVDKLIETLEEEIKKGA